MLHGEARSDMPNMNVGLELVYKNPLTKKRFALARLDWKSWKNQHRNKRRKGWPLRGKLCGETHYHAFELNYVADKEKMRPGDLPVADDIDGELQTFESLRAMAGFLLGINNIELVKRPPWEYTEEMEL